MSNRKAKNCPVCGWKLLPIIYGYPSPELFERDDIVIGGCIVDPMYPYYSCSNCDWKSQGWAVSAPLPNRIWILKDPDGLRKPIGLVTEQFNETLERFFAGGWEDIRTTEAYEAWLKDVPQPQVWVALGGDVDPATLANFRLGQRIYTSHELEEVGFKAFCGKAPKFLVRDPFPFLGKAEDAF